MEEEQVHNVTSDEVLTGEPPPTTFLVLRRAKTPTRTQACEMVGWWLMRILPGKRFIPLRSTIGSMSLERIAHSSDGTSARTLV